MFGEVPRERTGIGGGHVPTPTRNWGWIYRINQADYRPRDAVSEKPPESIRLIAALPSIFLTE
jgi:hypothetical protein